MQKYDTSIHSATEIDNILKNSDLQSTGHFDEAARGIVDDVIRNGTQAVLKYAKQFDWNGSEAATLEIPKQLWAEAYNSLDTDLQRVLRSSADNIRSFHAAELEHLQSWQVKSTAHTERGIQLGQLIRPIHRAGVYVPGGKAVYPSTVLMASIPAQVAGVEEVIVCTPPDQLGAVAPVLLAALHIADVSRAFRVGGAQSIAAMAYGVDPIPAVDVIVGPGNSYVNSAKKCVFGQVGIDMLAGPSEVAIIVDGSVPSRFVALDLLAQTEHGPGNRGFVLASTQNAIDDIIESIHHERETLSRRAIFDITGEALVFIKARDIKECVALCNRIAPEHLELCVADPHALLEHIRNAGAVLMGAYSSAPIGDYHAGPSHTLPTAGTARFSSPLSVNTFMKRSSVIEYSRVAAMRAADDVALLANSEGFDAHARAATVRTEVHA